MATHLRAIKFLDLLAGAAVLGAGVTSGVAVDTAGLIGPANHEMGSILTVGAVTAGALTNIQVFIQGNTTSVPTDAGWTNVATHANVTANGGNAIIYFTTTLQFIRAQVGITGAGVTTVEPICQLFMPQRFP